MGIEVHCPVCDGPQVWLGSLGNVDHYRCRDCGIDTSLEIPPDAPDACVWGEGDLEIPSDYDQDYCSAFEDLRNPW